MDTGILQYIAIMQGVEGREFLDIAPHSKGQCAVESLSMPLHCRGQWNPLVPHYKRNTFLPTVWQCSRIIAADNVAKYIRIPQPIALSNVVVYRGISTTYVVCPFGDTP